MADYTVAKFKKDKAILEAMYYDALHREIDGIGGRRVVRNDWEKVRGADRALMLCAGLHVVMDDTPLFVECRKLVEDKLSKLPPSLPYGENVFRVTEGKLLRLDLLMGRIDKDAFEISAELKKTQPSLNKIDRLSAGIRRSWRDFLRKKPECGGCYEDEGTWYVGLRYNIEELLRYRITCLNPEKATERAKRYFHPDKPDKNLLKIAEEIEKSGIYEKLDKYIKVNKVSTMRRTLYIEAGKDAVFKSFCGHGISFEA